MKKMVKRIAGIALSAAMCLSMSALAEVQVFDMVNVYSDEITQPGMTDAQKEALVKKNPGWEEELEYVKFSVEEAAFDGSACYLLVKATPKDPDKTLLLTAYGGDAEDLIPDSNETFAERAERENKKIVMAGMSVLGMGEELNDGASSSERYLEDGSLLLLTKYSFHEPTAGERQHRVCVREYLYGESEGNEKEKPLSLAPTTELAIARSEETFKTDFGTITQVELRRSALGARATVTCKLNDSLTEAQKKALENQLAEIWLDDQHQIPMTLGSAILYGKDGKEMFITEARGGETLVFAMELSAGEKMPESVLLKLLDASIKKQEGQSFTVRLESVPSNA